MGATLTNGIVERKEPLPFDSVEPGYPLWLRLYVRLLDAMAIIAAAMVVFSMLTVTGDVLLRFFFARGILWSFEVTEFLLLYIPMLAMPWLARRKGHVQIDLLLTWVGPRHARWLNAASYVAVCLLCLLMVRWSVLATLNSYSRGIVNAGLVAWPRWALLAVMPPAFLLTAIEFARLAWLEIRPRPGTGEMRS